MNERTPKIVLISATHDVNLLTEYFSQSTSDGLTQPCPSVNVQDRLFQVREFFLEDIMKEMSGRLLDIITTQKGLSSRFREAKHISKHIIEDADRLKSTHSMVPIQSSGIMAKIRHQTTIETTPTLLAAASITHVLKTTTQDAILVFLPGLRAITEVAVMLRFYSRRLTLPKCDVHALPQLPKEPMNSVPLPAQPGRRKVILATKIAETSIDIPDIAYVIDSGLDEVSDYNQFTGAADLRISWVSKADSRQRAGRAARVSDGRYYALFSKSHWNSLREREIPPIQRQDLQQTCLNVKNLFPREKIGQVLAEAIEPPQVAVIDAAITDLTQLGALTEQEDLTPLGVLLSRLPVDPAIGKMVILGIIFRCYEPMLILASANGTKFTNARLKYDTTRKNTHFQDYSGSDAVALVDAFQFASAMEHREDFAQLMRAAFLDISEFRSIQSKMAAMKSVLVREFKIILSHQKQEHPVGAPPVDIQVFFEKHNENSTNLALIKALSLATYPDHLAFRKGGNKFSTSLGDACMGYWTINNPCMLERMERLKQQATDTLLYSYSASSMSTMRTFVLENTTRLSPFAVALFSRDAQITERKGRKTLMINKWLTFDVTVDGKQSAESTSFALEKLMNFRRTIDVMLTNAFASLSSGGSRHSFLDPDPRVSKLVAVTAALLEQNLEVPQLAHLNLAGFDWNLGQDEPVGKNWWVGVGATSPDKSSGGVKV
ncbi:hypothetical protein HYALB_00003304 [Hymenoscyphus albidus]|uniref:Helicase C-terminal domain-containing protein n=1 Tax=Hymenoscyphus albidus TaxID=595503 RepID=A0A9N9LG35_9HELO|nr:hypothetical protein HYALB_00003304 [Hymenoscyphus albidus]